MITFDSVYKSFGEKKVLNGLNLCIDSGEIFFILGGSGTGKSVALKSLVGLHNIDSGTITYESKFISQYNKKEFQNIRSQISMVFQLPALLDSRTVLENLNLPIRHLKANKRFELIESALSACQLDHLKKDIFKTFPTQLSYGEQKRLALARSLVASPKVLLYDEPTTGMDSETAREIHKLIFKISREFKTTSIVVSHDINNAITTADKIAMMHEGQSLFCGTPDELLAFDHPLVQKFLDASRISLPQRKPHT